MAKSSIKNFRLSLSRNAIYAIFFIFVSTHKEKLKGINKIREISAQKGKQPTVKLKYSFLNENLGVQ